MSKKKGDISEERPYCAVRKAVILAGGVGSRLHPFTDEQPKCLVPVNGVSVLVNALTHLANAGGEKRKSFPKLVGVVND